MKTEIKLQEPSKLLRYVLNESGTSGADDILTLEFENGEKIRLESYHRGDCCERVYVDFEANLNVSMNKVPDDKIAGINIIGVPDIGFMLTFTGEPYSYEVMNKLLFACYDIQNGYYSGDLALTIDHDDVRHTYDISDLTEKIEG